jgi:thiosulfate dehydrogenase
VKLLLGIVLGLVGVAAGAFLFCKLGLVPVATASQPLPFERTLAETALHARMVKEAPSAVPTDAGDTNLQAGAQLYRDNCGVCHGTRGQAETGIAKGMFPKPPQFFAHSSESRPAGDTYWAVKNGIRLTGMPGFGGSLTDQQLWQVSLFLSQGDKPSEAR